MFNSRYYLDKEEEKEEEKVETESASLESTYENEIGFGEPVPTEDTEEIGDTAAICSDLFQQLIEANFSLGQSQHEIHNFTGIDIAPIDSPSLDDIFIHPIGKHFIFRLKGKRSAESFFVYSSFAKICTKVLMEKT